LKNRKTDKNLTESQIIALAKKEVFYFGKLYNKYFNAIFSFVFKRLGGAEDIASDLTQQIFMKAMANIQKYEDRGHPFSSWLYRIANNQVYEYFRKKKRIHEVPVDQGRIQDLGKEVNTNSYMSLEVQEKLIEMINNLEQVQQDLIELRFFEEMSFKEIAAIYNITEANAKMRTYRILERIRNKWEN
jgi:RNA polymerase sigma-70 factor (ECF subfamily)